MSEFKYQEASLENILTFWVEQYEIPANTHIHSWEWFYNPHTKRVMFKMFVADGPDPLATTSTSTKER